MPKNLNSYILTDNIIKLMKQKLRETKRTHKELGFSLCHESGDNELKDDGHCVGTSCDIKIIPCKKGDTVGTFHTHPKDDSEPSLSDMRNAYNYGISCIGGEKDKKIRCIVRKAEYNTLDKSTFIYFDAPEYYKKSIKERFFNDIQIK
jgi:hypothetical protein